jgi:hypothetical protein
MNHPYMPPQFVQECELLETIMELKNAMMEITQMEMDVTQTAKSKEVGLVLMDTVELQTHVLNSEGMASIMDNMNVMMGTIIISMDVMKTAQ